MQGALTVGAPSAVKATVPVGTDDDGAAPVTVARSSNGTPNCTGLADEVTVTAVAFGSTICTMEALLDRKGGLGPKLAVTGWLPKLRSLIGANVATPSLLRRAAWNCEPICKSMQQPEGRVLPVAP